MAQEIEDDAYAPGCHSHNIYNKVYAAHMCKHKCKDMKKNRTLAQYLHIIKIF